MGAGGELNQIVSWLLSTVMIFWVLHVSTLLLRVMMKQFVLPSSLLQSDPSLPLQVRLSTRKPPFTTLDRRVFPLLLQSSLRGHLPGFQKDYQRVCVHSFNKYVSSVSEIHNGIWPVGSGRLKKITWESKPGVEFRRVGSKCRSKVDGRAF